MNKLNSFFTGLVLLFFLMSFISCSPGKDYSGSYKLKDGNCISKNITLKKVSGFGNKYYLVHIQDKSFETKEFLGVIKGNRITVDSGIIILENNSIRVEVGKKRCLYIKN